MTALISLGIRALVLLSLAWIGAALLRRRSASIRASVWTAAFAAVLALTGLYAWEYVWVFAGQSVPLS